MLAPPLANSLMYEAMLPLVQLAVTPWMWRSRVPNSSWDLRKYWFCIGDASLKLSHRLCKEFTMQCTLCINQYRSFWYLAAVFILYMRCWSCFHRICLRLRSWPGACSECATIHLWLIHIESRAQVPQVKPRYDETTCSRQNTL